MNSTLIETVRVVNGTAPLWTLHLARIQRSCAALGFAFPTLVPPQRGPDRVCRYEISPDGVRVSEREPGPTAPVRIITARTWHKPYPNKIADRACFEQAQVEAAAASANDAVLMTPQGWVAEGTIWSILWWEMGLLCAPALEIGILPSVGRARVSELKRYVGERKLTRRALSGVPLFLVNSARGIVEVDTWDGERVPRYPETARLASQFWP
ncbi:MAG: aminotransferase class IV [Gemmatimonadota bacterium]